MAWVYCAENYSKNCIFALFISLPSYILVNEKTRYSYLKREIAKQRNIRRVVGIFSFYVHFASLSSSVCTYIFAIFLFAAFAHFAKVHLFHFILLLKIHEDTPCLCENLAFCSHLDFLYYFSFSYHFFSIFFHRDTFSEDLSTLYFYLAK